MSRGHICTKPSATTILTRNWPRISPRVIILRCKRIVLWSLTHIALGKKAAISQTTCSNAFSWMKIFEFEIKFHWSMFIGSNWQYVRVLNKQFHRDSWSLSSRAHVDLSMIVTLFKCRYVNVILIADVFSVFACVCQCQAILQLASWRNDLVIGSQRCPNDFPHKSAVMRPFEGFCCQPE